MKQLKRYVVLSLAGLLALCAVPRAQAKEHGGKEHGGKEHTGGTTAHSGKPAGFEKGRKEGWKKKGTTRPPGWEKGKKTGWEGTSKPPGQTQ